MFRKKPYLLIYISVKTVKLNIVYVVKESTREPQIKICERNEM